jgi:hypothetical protein
MNLRTALNIAGTVGEVVFTNCQYEIPKLIYPHRISNFKVAIGTLVRKISNNDVGFLDETNDLALKQASPIVLINSL